VECNLGLAESRVTSDQRKLAECETMLPRPFDRLERHLVAANEHGNALVVRKWSRLSCRCWSLLPTPFWSLLDQRPQFFSGSASILEPIGHVPLVGHFWPVAGKIEHAHTPRNAGERGANYIDAFLSVGIVVGNYDDIGAAQGVGVLLGPFLLRT